MKDDLPPIGVAVDLNPISARGHTFFLGEFACLEGEPSQQLRLLRSGIVESRHVLFRDQKKMNRGFWVDVLEDQDLIVLVYNSGGDLTGSYFAEDTVGHGFTPFQVWGYGSVGVWELNTGRF